MAPHFFIIQEVLTIEIYIIYIRRVAQVNRDHTVWFSSHRTELGNTFACIATQYYVISCNTIQTPEPIIELHSSFTFGRCTIINVELETQIVVWSHALRVPPRFHHFFGPNYQLSWLGKFFLAPITNCFSFGGKNCPHLLPRRRRLPPPELWRKKLRSVNY